MKTYRVWASCINYCYLDVEAEDEDDAYEIAKETDGGEFMSYDDGAWEIDNVEELNEDPE